MLHEDAQKNKKMYKKLLLLGGSMQQVVAIDTAKRLGLYTVLCDYLDDNPGQFHADKFYLVSTTDKDAVLKVAESECIDGIVAYASDPAAPTAAYVAEKLGLPGNPYKTALTFCNKDMFREFLKINGFNVPISNSYISAEEAVTDIVRYKFPVIIKPTDSSGSKGVTVVYNEQMLGDALEYAFSFSRAHRVVVEEYIEKAHPYLIGGDIFVKDGKVTLWGLMNCHRDERVNPLVPVGKSYPLFLDKEDEELARETLQDLVTKSGYRNGAMNVEMVIDMNHRCWLIDVGPRNGGNMIPDLCGYIFDIDIVEMTVRMAIGEEVSVEIGAGIPFYASQNLHTDKNGRYENVWFSDEIKPYVIKTFIYKKIGDEVEYFSNASAAIGIIFMKFEDRETMRKMLSNIDKHIRVKVSEEE